MAYTVLSGHTSGKIGSLCRPHSKLSYFLPEVLIRSKKKQH